MIIAIDFDGTIVEHKYPEIGRPIPFAIDTLLQLQKEQHKLILWSVREGQLLQDAVDYCAEQGLYFAAHNENYLGEDKTTASRKLNADLFIDDRNLGGLPDWGVIYNAIQAMVNGRNPYEVMMGAHPTQVEKKKKGWFR